VLLPAGKVQKKRAVFELFSQAFLPCFWRVD
jgi:hypothetical protein